MIHGGDLITYEKYYDGELIDFSSNINPLGPPEGLNEKLIESFNTLVSYPDIKYRHLKSSIAKYLKCNVENVVIGNGAVEIINNFIFMFPRIIIFLPSFLEYEQRALIYDKEIVRLNYNENFSLNLEQIEKVIQPNDLLILGNPNNPTGLRIEKDILIKIFNIVKKNSGFLLLDEAFYEFCPKDYDSIEEFEKYSFQNIGIIRAATKFFALPGIRLGYGCTSKSLVEKYERIELPWSINALADTAGKFIFECNDYIKKSKSYIENERMYLLEELSNIQGIKAFKTHTNYILIKLFKWHEEYVFNFFLKNGLVIRKCSSFSGLDETYIRVAIKDRKSNKRLVEVFKKLEMI